MFYSQLVLAKKGPLGKIWLAAHMEKKVPKLSIIETNIPESVENIETVPMALRVSGHLLLGVVRIFSRKVTYLLTDCSEALVKIKDAFRAPGGVELAPGAGTKSYEEITRHDQLDEMDLDADLTDQPMLFTIEDGIELPDGLDGIELPDPEKDEFALSGFPAQEAGFPADEKLECLAHFFPEAKQRPSEEEEEEDDDDDDDALEAEGLGHSAKRQRASPAKDEPEIYEEEEEERPEKLLSHTGGLAGGVDVDALPVGDEQMFSEEFDDCQRLGEEEENALDHDLPLNDFEAPAMAEEQEEQEDGLDQVMSDGMRRERTPVGSPKPDKDAVKRVNPRPKRKMIIDSETQLSSDFLRKQLEDPSAIVRDFKAEAAAKAAKAGKANRSSLGGRMEHDPLVDAPRSFYLPSSVASMQCFWPKSRMPAPKRMRAAHPSLHHDEDDEGEGEGEEETLEVLRSASRGDGAQQVGGLAVSATDLEEGVQRDGEGKSPLQEMELEEFPMDEEELGAPQLPLDEDELAAEEAEEEAGEEAEVEAAEEAVEQPTGFNPALELPNVNSEGGADAASQCTPQGTHDPAAWNPRTRKMYAVLQAAFDKSHGAPLSYDAMIKRTRKSADKRKVVAGCFQELLFLTTHGMIELEQSKPYCNILISKTELFGKTDAA